MNPSDPPAAGGYALLTSPGPAAIACIRVWGPQAAEFVSRHLRLSSDLDAREAGQVRRAALVQADGEALDDILVSVHTGSPGWDLQLHLHGNPVLVRRCATLLEDCGLQPCDTSSAALRPAPGLLDAEAIELLPRVCTRRGVAWLLSQPRRLREAITALRGAPFGADARETCRAIAARRSCLEWFTQPLRLALVGPPNAGKSTLVNSLADRPVSLVASRPGTTRDWVEVSGEIAGQPVVWLDTAGLRDSTDPLERAGLERTRVVAKQADAIVVVLDSSPEAAHVTEEFMAAHGDFEPAAVALNKVDRLADGPKPGTGWPVGWMERAVPISAREGTGLHALRERVVERLGRCGAILDTPAAFTDRQDDCLKALAAATDPKAIQTMLLQLEGGEGAAVSSG